VNLVVHIPETSVEAAPYVQTLMKRAPSFTIEGQDWIAIFPQLPDAIDLALQIVGESVRIPDAWASMNGRQLSSLLRLWARLECYRESLDAASPEQHCLRKAGKHNLLEGCSGSTCPVSCQFVCMPCRAEIQNGGSPPVEGHFLRLADMAEVEWCPNLHLPEKHRAANGLPFAL
jgi:hypothetical protein